MGLREMLQSLGATQELTQKAAQSGLDLRKQEQLAALTQQYTGGGPDEKIAGDLLSIGDTSGLRELLQGSQRKLAQGPKQAATLSDVEFSYGNLGLPVPKSATTLVGKDIGEVQRAAQAARNAQEFGNEMGFKRESEGRRIKEQGAKWQSQFNKPLMDNEKKVTEQLDSLAIQAAGLKNQPNPATKRSLAVSLARAAGEVGALSNQDLDAYNLRSLFGDVKGFMNYVTDPSLSSSIPDAQVDVLIEMVGRIGKEKKARTNKLLTSQATDLLNANPEIYDAATVKNWEKKLGVKFEEREDGTFEAKMPVAPKGGMEGGKDTGKTVKLPSWLDKVVDEKAKTKMIEFINSRPDITEAQLEQLRKNAAKLIKE